MPSNSRAKKAQQQRRGQEMEFEGSGEAARPAAQHVARPVGRPRGSTKRRKGGRPAVGTIRVTSKRLDDAGISKATAEAHGQESGGVQQAQGGTPPRAERSKKTPSVYRPSPKKILKKGKQVSCVMEKPAPPPPPGSRQGFATRDAQGGG
eukprot:jgi/Mesvir1/23768/Mv06221-RA.1